MTFHSRIMLEKTSRLPVIDNLPFKDYSKNPSSPLRLFVDIPYVSVGICSELHGCFYMHVFSSLHYVSPPTHLALTPQLYSVFLEFEIYQIFTDH